MSRLNLAREFGSPAIIRGGGLLRPSSLLMVDAVDPILEVDKFRLWPLPWLPWLLVVDARDLPLPGLTRSVRICR